MTNKDVNSGILDGQAVTNILVRKNIITSQEKDALLNAFAAYDGDEFIEFLLDEELVNESDLLEALGEHYQVPAVDVLGYFFYHDLLAMFPKTFLLENEIIPLTVDENIMIMIAAHPNDPQLATKIAEHVSYDIQFCVGIARDIRDEVEEFYDTADTDINPDSESRIGFTGPIGPDELNEGDLIIELYDLDEEGDWSNRYEEEEK